MTVLSDLINVEISGARGPSFSDVARATGQWGVAADATDAQVLDALAADLITNNPGLAGPTGASGTLIDNSGFTAGGASLIKGDAAALLQLQKADGTSVIKADSLEAFTGYAGVATKGAGRIFIGTLTPTGDDAGVCVGRDIDGTGLFPHGFRDESTFKSSGDSAYAAFDANFTMAGSGDKNHLRCFQARAIYACDGTVDQYAPFSSGVIVSDGAINEMPHFYVENPTIDGGSVVSQYGLYVRPLSGATNNFGVFVEGDNESSFGGDVQTLGQLRGASMLISGHALINQIFPVYNTELEVNGVGAFSNVKLALIPTYADEAAAGAASLDTSRLYKTSTGEVRIKL
jgi:hypothetical protein